MIHFKLQSVTRAGVLGWTLSGVLIYTPAVLAATGSDTQSCPVAPPPLSLPAGGNASTLVADQASLANDIATAQGHVHLERNGQALEAPYVRYNRKTTQVRAHGGLKYRRQGLYLSAQHGWVNINQRTGEFEQAHYKDTDNNANGKARTFRAVGSNRYQLTDADYSTCPGRTKAWQLSAPRVMLDRRAGRGVAHDATMKLYGLPVLYTPYLSFPLDNRRQSGFLAPAAGVSGKSGFELTTPYYFNLAPNYDATLIPRVMSERGLQLGGQFRYLTRHHWGEFDGEYVPYDFKYGAQRDLVHFHDSGQITPHIGIQANYSRVSDDQYFQDFSSDLAHTSTSNLDRSIKVTAARPGVQLSVLAQDFQTLYPSFTSAGGLYSNHPYRRLPQINLSVLTPTAPLQLGLDTQFSRFERNDSVNGNRTDVHPRLVWGIDHGGWYTNAQLAYRFTHYQLSNLAAAGSSSELYFTPDQHTVNREIPSVTADAGLRLSRTLGNGWIQTLEPRIQYHYVGYQNQSHIPIFDSGSPTLDYDELFAGNRYTGLDRIGDANQIVLGVRSRFIAPDSGRTVASFNFGRVTSFRKLRVTLPYTGDTGYGTHGSDYLFGGSFAPRDWLRTDAAIQYNSHWSHLDRAYAMTTVGHDNGYQLTLGYRYYRNYRSLNLGRYESLSQTLINARAPLSSQVNLIGRWNYSLAQRQNVEALVGLEYRPSCCYAIRLAWRQYVSHQNNSYNKGNMNSSVMFQFVLHGLGRFGNSMSSFVSGNIFGPTSEPR